MTIAKATIVTVEATTISQVAKTSVAAAAAAAATTIEIWKVLLAQMHNSFGLLNVQLTYWQWTTQL